ncbi:MAG: RIP metalloprotease RseP [Candidatus Omnitrophota bacterium]|jgi:regulator of sigma E protease
MNLFIFLIILSILIIVHEFGHFIVARQSKVKVEKFAIGFGPVLFTIKGKNTDFVLCLFPLGGYVKMAGDNRPESKGLEHEFFSKTVLTRIKIVFAGPFFNYIFAFLLFWAIAVMGFPYIEPVVGKVKEGFPAQNYGIKEGDRVLSVNGKKVEHWLDMTQFIRESKKSVSLEIERQGEKILLTVPLEKTEGGDEFGRKKSVSIIGIEASSRVKMVKYNLFQGSLKALEAVYSLTVLTIKGFVFMISGTLSVKEAVTGPLGIYYITSETIKLGMVAILNLMAILSVSLAIVNLIPLPLFDGGHILLFLIEKIRGKAVSEKIDMLLTRIGIAIIGTIVLFVFYNDIVKFGSRIWGKWF